MVGQRGVAQLVLDMGLAASVLSWGLLGLGVDERPLAIRLSLCALNVTVAVLFATRRGARHDGDMRALIAALPSIVVAAMALRWTASSEWSLGPQILFVAAVAFTTISLISLGRSFALLPSLRAVVEHGPYRLVRHPAYAGELMIAAACAWVRPWPGLLALAIAFLAALVRIHAEERTLAHDELYRAYLHRVRYRLIPGLV